MKLSSWNLPVTKFIKQNCSRNKLLIKKERIWIYTIYTFHKHWQMVTETKHFPIHQHSSVGNSVISFLPIATATEKNPNLQSLILQLLIPLLYSTLKVMFHNSTVYLKDKQKANRLAKPISSKSRVNGIYFCGTLLEVSLMLFTVTSFTYLSCCIGRLSKPCCYQMHLLPVHKSSAWTAGCKSQEGKILPVMFLTHPKQWFRKSGRSLQLHSNYRQMFRV